MFTNTIQGSLKPLQTPNSSLKLKMEWRRLAASSPINLSPYPKFQAALNNTPPYPPIFTPPPPAMEQKLLIS